MLKFVWAWYGSLEGGWARPHTFLGVVALVRTLTCICTRGGRVHGNATCTGVCTGRHRRQHSWHAPAAQPNMHSHCGRGHFSHGVNRPSSGPLCPALCCGGLPADVNAALTIGRWARLQLSPLKYKCKGPSCMAAVHARPPAPPRLHPYSPTGQHRQPAMLVAPGLGFHLPRGHGPFFAPGWPPSQKYPCSKSCGSCRDA